MNEEYFFYQRANELMYQQYAYEEVKFQIVTFNVNEKPPENIFSRILAYGYDLYVVVLYEISMSVKTILLNSSRCAEGWVQQIRRALSPQYSYRVVTRQLGGLLLVVVHTERVVIEDMYGVPCGGNNMANKGGINCFIRCQNSRFLFTGCHLAASRQPDGMIKRNNNLERVLNERNLLQTRLKSEDFGNVDQFAVCITQFLRDLRTQHVQNVYCYTERPFLLKNSRRADVVFVFGDLNYRLYCRNHIDYIRDGRFKYLLLYDELHWYMNGCQNPTVTQQTRAALTEGEVARREGGKEAPTESNGGYSEFSTLWGESTTKEGVVSSIRENPVLKYFVEEYIDFPPTYKFKDGQYTLARDPAYCDRIIYQVVNQDARPTIERYTSVPEVTVSDHQPVTMTGRLPARLELSLSAQMVEHIRLEWQEVVAALRPEVALVRGTFVVGTARYGMRYSGTFEVKNSHPFSSVTLAVDNKHEFIRFADSTVCVQARRTTRIAVWVQVLGPGVQPGTYEVELAGNMVALRCAVRLDGVSYDFLSTDADRLRVPRGLLSIGGAVLSSGTGLAGQPPCSDPNRIYEALYAGMPIHCDAEALGDILVSYVCNVGVLDAHTREALSQQVLRCGPADYSDIWCCFDEFLSIEQRDFVLYVQKVAVWLHDRLKDAAYLRRLGRAIFGGRWAEDVFAIAVRENWAGG